MNRQEANLYSAADTQRAELRLTSASARAGDHTARLKDTENLVSGHDPGLGDTAAFWSEMARKSRSFRLTY